MIFASNILIPILVVTFTIILIVVLLMYLFTKKLYSFIYGRRYDKTFLHFFNHNDYEGLNAEPIEFKTNNDNTLRGFIYSYSNETYKGLVVISHGLGVGHLQYTHEINHFAKLGFKVVSFDNTGCATSDGEEGINGLPQGIIDLKSCLEFIKTRDDLNKYKKVLFGHSWGGYSSLNVTPFTNEEDNIACVVTMGAPFSSIDITYEMLKANIKILGFTRPFITSIEKGLFGDICKLNTLSTLENINYDVLMVHGTKDHIVNYESNFKFVIDCLNKENVEFLTVENKRHRPNISDEATKLDEKVGNDIANLKKNKATKEELKEYHDNINYHQLVEFDTKVMEHIDNFVLRHFK